MFSSNYYARCLLETRGPVVSFNSNSLCKWYYCPHLQMSKLRLGEARSHWCLFSTSALCSPGLAGPGRRLKACGGCCPFIALWCLGWFALFGWGWSPGAPLAQALSPDSLTHLAEVGLQDVMGLSGHAPVRRRDGLADQPILQARKL